MVIKPLIKIKQLMEEILTDFGSQFGGTVHDGGDGRWQAHEAAALVAFTIRKQKDGNDASQLAFPFYCSPDASQWGVAIHIQGGQSLLR